MVTINGIAHQPEVLCTFHFTDHLAELQMPLTRERDFAAFDGIKGPREYHS
jgi:hypothetical protein